MLLQRKHLLPPHSKTSGKKKSSTLFSIKSSQKEMSNIVENKHLDIFCKKCTSVRNPNSNSKTEFGKLSQHSRDLKTTFSSKEGRNKINDFKKLHKKANVRNKNLSYRLPFYSREKRNTT